MPSILTIAGSPSASSRSSAFCEYTRQYVEARGVSTAHITVRDLDPADLIYGRYDGETIKPALAQVAAADGLVIATPVYKAAYTGVLKSFLDVLPAGALANKLVLPVASGGSPAHSLVVDYALKPVLAALGARRILLGLYLIDSEYTHNNGHQLQFIDPEAEMRVNAALEQLLHELSP